MKVNAFAKKGRKRTNPGHKGRVRDGLKYLLFSDLFILFILLSLSYAEEQLPVGRERPAALRCQGLRLVAWDPELRHL